MTVLGGKSRRSIRRVSVVIEHEMAHSTWWVLKEVLDGIESAQGTECEVTVFILSGSADEEFEYLSDLANVTTLHQANNEWVSSVMASLQRSDALVVAGVEANRVLSQALKAPTIYLPIMVDLLGRDPIFLPDDASILELVALKADTIFFSSERARSNAETIAPAICERTQIFGPGILSIPEVHEDPDPHIELIQAVSSLTDRVNAHLLRLAARYRELRNPPTTTIVGTRTELELLIRGDFGDVRFLPGVRFCEPHQVGIDAINRITLLDDLEDSDNIAWRCLESFQARAIPVALSRIESHELLEVLIENRNIPRNWKIGQSDRHFPPSLSTLVLKSLEPNELSNDAITRVVLAGRDFKFASLIVRELNSASDIEFVLDHSKVGREQSSELCKWADVIITEFLTPHAVWYSKHLPTHKRLIVHMHGYELYKPLVHDLNIRNVHRVVVPSEAYRQKVLQKTKWPERLVQVIPNGGLVQDLCRTKDPLARFRLGMVGWVPSLKRVDRALDLLEELIAVDSRYVLEIRGALPWNYKWAWERPAHRDMYMNVLERLRANPVLAHHVTFAPFGADVGNWLRGIGWMLSPSARESFHLAPVEGMISGAIPIVWSRDGAAEVFGDAWIFEDTTSATEYILETNSTTSGWETHSQEAQKEALSRYDETMLRAQWHELIVSKHLNGSLDIDSTPPRDNSGATIQSSFYKGQSTTGGAYVHKEATPAKGCNDLKYDAQAWVAGHAQLPELLLSMRYGLETNTKVIDQRGFMHVMVASKDRSASLEVFGATSFVLLAPPPGSRASHDYTRRSYSAFEPLITVIGDDFPETLTLDEYIVKASAQLTEQAELSGASSFRVDGPYWAVLAALHAAITTHGDVQWDLSQNLETNIESFRASIHSVTDDPIKFSSKLIADHVGSVVIDEAKALPPVLLEMCSEDKLVLVTDATSLAQLGCLAVTGDAVPGDELPKISIIVSSKRADSDLFTLFASISAQSYPQSKVELLVNLYDSGSRKQGEVEQYLHRAEEILDWQIYVSDEDNISPESAAGEHATGDFIMFLNEDARVEKHHLASMAAVSERNTIVVGLVANEDHEGNLYMDTNLRCALGSNRVPAPQFIDLFETLPGKLFPRSIFKDWPRKHEIDYSTYYIVASHLMEKSLYIERIQG